MRSGAPYPRLVGDVGGTSARFGWVRQRGDGIAKVATYACAEHAGLEAVIARYLAEHPPAAPAACAIAIAVPVSGDVLAMTNLAWTFSVSELRRRLGFERMVVLNDFSALALAIAQLAPDERVQVGGGQTVVDAPVALLGPGTGLGVAALVNLGGVALPIAGEGGHVSLSAADAAEDRVVSRLREQFGHVSAERALSGAGLVNLYRVLCELAGRPAEPLAARDISARALAGADDQCRAAVELFFAFLGSVAGNLALTLGARGGVYVGGGIVPRLGGWIARSRFRERFESKGRYQSYLANIPTWVISSAEAPALRGANRALDEAPPGAQVSRAG